MQIGVSIPDDLVRRTETLAFRLGKSPSEIYRQALADSLARHESAAVVTPVLDGCADELAADHEGFVARAARRTLVTCEW